MAANKFATMLHRKTNRLTVILVYALLEWILIIALLVNSLFWYVIVKFAEYFGLKKPCLFCSRVDHVFELESKSSYRDLVCEIHGSEISELGFCVNHRKLVESKDMCVDCNGFSKKVDSKCSCCGVNLESKLLSSYFVIKPSWEVLDYPQKGDLIGEKRVDDEIDDGHDLDRSRSDFVNAIDEDEDGVEKNGGVQMLSDTNGDLKETEKNCSSFVSNFGDTMTDEDDEVDVVMEIVQRTIKEDDLSVAMADLSGDQAAIQAGLDNDESRENLPQHLEFVIDSHDYQLIPVDLVDSSNVEENQDFVLDFDFEEEKRAEKSLETVALLSAYESMEKPIIVENKLMDFGEIIEGFSSFNEVADLIIMEECEQVSISADVVHHEWKEDINMRSDETEPEVSIGTEIPVHEPIDEYQNQDDLGSMQTEDRFVEFKTISVETSEQCSGFHEIKEDKVPDIHSEDKFVEFKTISVQVNEGYSGFNEMEEDKFPSTPNSVDSFQHLSRKLSLLERGESGTEESLGSSVISEIDGGEGVFTVEKLTSALKAERKALNALYAELEEERNASAVAANQTMAMINRLQEEKAAMQMEALQYQRMMDEQSEYDQETLQLLNELMVKREKENQELEKELEMYKKKVLEYEAKQKMALLRRKDGSSRSRNSAAYCSNGDDSDGLSIDLNHEGKEEDGYNSNHESNNNNTPVDAVLYLEESLSSFEEERMSILEQLKVLEEKLFTLSDEEDQHFEDVKPIENFPEENGNGYHEYYDNGHFKETNGKHDNGRRLDLKAKRLLPLFDAIDSETEDGILNGNEHEFDSSPTRNSSSTLNLELENKKLAIEEEVDHVYERLQALEADREFLKHCMNSLRKGDKGIHLLQEILQHLCDLRSVDRHCAKNGDATAL